MPPKKAEEQAEETAEEEPEEPAEPPPPREEEITELSTGLLLPLRPLDVGEIWALAPDFAAQGTLLTQLLGLEDAFPLASQRSVVSDFYLFNLTHAKFICLTQRQGAVFHAIMARVLNMMMCSTLRPKSKPQNAACGAPMCFAEFQNLLLPHSVSDPPDRLNVFSVSEAKMLTDFASATLFKHFLLYQFCINCEQEVQTLRINTTLQKPLAPPDLGAARQKPKRKSAEEQQQTAGVPDMTAAVPAVAAEDTAAAAIAEGVGGPGEESPEDDEITRLVEEKLRETEAALQAKFEAREEAFRQKLLSRGKGKK